MDRKIRVGAVSYLNTKPLIYGFEQGLMQDEIDLVIDYPAKIADALINNEVDLGLVPIAIIPSMKEWHIVSDYCIGSDGEVNSVCLFSEVPIEEIEIVLLDYQSKTSVALVQILLKEYWKIAPVFITADENFQTKIAGTTAAVVIGDRAFEQRKHSAYAYDLGKAWKVHTGLPFVFAAWVSNKLLPGDFIKNFNDANEAGFDKLEQIAGKYSNRHVDLMKYYTEFIKYKLTDGMHESINLFLSKLNR